MQKNDEIRHPKSWLCGAAVNKCVDKQRYNNRFRRIVTEEETAEMTPENDSFDGGENELSFAISKLNRDERGLVVLYSEGLSYKEIAEATGIKFTSVGKTLSRTLKKIEKELRKMKV
jgi:RNA polymerase sigma-70 factor (ECF subfamily)